MSNKSSKFRIRVDGHDIDITPKGAEVHPESCISKEKFEIWFTIIGYDDTKTMISEGSTTLTNVRFHEHSRDKTSSQDAYIFNAISIQDIDVLDRASFVRDGELHIDMRSSSELSLCMPRHVTSDRPLLSSIGKSDPQPVEKLEQGERYDIRVGYTRFAPATHGNISEKTSVEKIKI